MTEFSSHNTFDLDCPTFALCSQGVYSQPPFRSCIAANALPQFWRGTFNIDKNPFLEPCAINDGLVPFTKANGAVNLDAENFSERLLVNVSSRERIATIHSSYRHLNRLWVNSIARIAPANSAVYLLGADFLFTPSRIRRARPDLQLHIIDPLDDFLVDMVDEIGIGTELRAELSLADSLNFLSQSQGDWLRNYGVTTAMNFSTKDFANAD
jgi:hypothetical protein